MSSINLLAEQPLAVQSNLKSIMHKQNLLYAVFTVVRALTPHKTTILLSPEDVDNKGYIIAGNHQSALDPFIITGSLPRNVWKLLTPLRFMVLNYYMELPVLGKALWDAGCYPASANDRYPSGITASRTYLDEDISLMIFPEGKRSRGGQPARSGVAVLAKQTKVNVIPAHLEWTRHRFGLRSYTLVIGKPIDASKMTPQKILDHIYSL